MIATTDVSKAKKSKKANKESSEQAASPATPEKVAKQKKAKKPADVKVKFEELESLKDSESLLKKIESQEKWCGELAVQIEMMRTEFKELRGSYQSATLELRRLCRARREKMPLFDKKDARSEPVKNGVDVQISGTGETAPKLSAEFNDQAKPVTPPSDAAKQAWRDLPLSAASINGNVGKLLEEAGHDTLGKVSKLMSDHGQWWNKEVKGIGEAGSTEVADRFADFWAAHPEFCG